MKCVPIISCCGIGVTIKNRENPPLSNYTDNPNDVFILIYNHFYVMSRALLVTTAHRVHRETEYVIPFHYSILLIYTLNLLNLS